MHSDKTIVPTQASTEMKGGIIYHRYGTSSRRKWRQTGRGGVGGGGWGGGAPSSPSRTASQTTSLGLLNWWILFSRVLSVQGTVRFQNQDRWVYTSEKNMYGIKNATESCINLSRNLSWVFQQRFDSRIPIVLIWYISQLNFSKYSGLILTTYLKRVNIETF